MHSTKIARLTEAGLLQPVLGVAARFKVGADDVVHALQGRSVPGEAKSAAAALDPDQRRALKELPWPHTCPGCHGLADELLTCPGCGVKGCEACAVPGKCPACRRGEAEQAAAVERKADELRRQQAERDRGAAEAAEASKKILEGREAARQAREKAARPADVRG